MARVAPRFSYRRMIGQPPEVLLHMENLTYSFSTEDGERLRVQLEGALAHVRDPSSDGIMVSVPGLTSAEARMLRAELAKLRAEGRLSLPLLRVIETLAKGVQGPL